MGVNLAQKDNLASHSTRDPTPRDKLTLNSFGFRFDSHDSFPGSSFRFYPTPCQFNQAFLLELGKQKKRSKKPAFKLLPAEKKGRRTEFERNLILEGFHLLLTLRGFG